MRFITDDSKSEPKIKRPCVRVICAGLSRCATSSLQAALESDVLGVEPCMHMARIIPHPERQLLVIAALKEVDTPKRRKILHQIFDGYASTADFPGWVFTSDLMDMYPDAVIVLNQRDCPEDWERSMGSTLNFFRSWWYFITTCLWTTNRLRFFVMRETYQLSGRRFGIEKPDFVTF